MKGWGKREARTKEGVRAEDRRKAKEKIVERTEPLHISKSKCGQKKIIYKKREEMVEEKKQRREFENQRWNFEVFEIRIANDIDNIKYDEWN